MQTIHNIRSITSMPHNPRVRSFLADQTNEGDLQIPKDNFSLADTHPPKSIRRASSFQLGHSRLSSSSTTASDENDSIYNASAAASGLDLSMTDNDPSKVSHQPEGISTSPHGSIFPLDESLLGWLDLQRPRTSTTRPLSPKSHSKWPAKQLDTITEQRSIPTLGKSASTSTLPRQASRPSVHVRLPEGSLPEEVPKSQLRNPRESRNTLSETRVKAYEKESSPGTLTPYHRRSFSLNDLDCLPRLRSRWRRSHDKPSSQSSSSSSGSFNCSSIFRDLCSFPASPVQPIHPPPIRVKTPPGVPSFGSKEAVSLVNRNRIRRRRSNNPTIRETSFTDIPSNTNNPLLTTSETQQPSSSTPTTCPSRTARFLNLLAFASPESYTVPTVAPLPPESLRASDGTTVRGRFHSRQSGHGIGGGGPSWQGLESHPFHAASTAEVSSGEAEARASNEAAAGRTSWEPTGNSEEPVMTGAIQEFLNVGGGRAAVEDVGERLREEATAEQERGRLRRCGRWFCVACCAWDLDDGTGAVAEGSPPQQAGGSGYMAGSRMIY